jgi:uncharacterized membrane protein
LIFFVPSLGAAIGAATGAASGALLETDSGINDDFMRRMGEELQPGKAAVLMLVRKAVPENVLPTLSGRSVLLTAALRSEIVELPLEELVSSRAELAALRTRCPRHLLSIGFWRR